MTHIPAPLLEIAPPFQPTSQPALDFDGWRIAMLRHFDVVDPQAFGRVERHRNTNEVFILTTGEAALIVCDGEAEPSSPQVLSMEAHVAYNVRRSVWHHVVMSPEAHIVLFERSETSSKNTDYAELSFEIAGDLRRQFVVGRRKPETSEPDQ